MSVLLLMRYMTGFTSPPISLSIIFVLILIRMAVSSDSAEGGLNQACSSSQQQQLSSSSSPPSDHPSSSSDQSSSSSSLSPTSFAARYPSLPPYLLADPDIRTMPPDFLENLSRAYAILQTPSSSSSSSSYSSSYPYFSNSSIERHGPHPSSSSLPGDQRIDSSEEEERMIRAEGPHPSLSGSSSRSEENDRARAPPTSPSGESDGALQNEARGISKVDHFLHEQFLSLFLSLLLSVSLLFILIFLGRCLDGLS